MIKRTSPESHTDTKQLQSDLIEQIEHALELAVRLGQHRTAAGLEDALVQANRANISQ